MIKIKIIKSLYVLGICLLISAISFAQLKAGQDAPGISLSDVKGKLENLSDHKGKVVLVDFWASWCAPCRKANPNLVRLYKKYKQKGFEIFGVSIDENKTSWKKAIASDKITWPQVIETGDGMVLSPLPGK